MSINKSEIRNQMSDVRSQIVFVVFLLSSVFCILSSVAYADVGAAWQNFLEGDYKKAISEAENIKGADAHYVMGLSYLKLGKPTHARKHFIFIKDVHPSASIKEEIALSIADSYFLEGDFNNAAIKYTSFLKAYPASGLAAMAYLKLGQSQRRLGYWAQAKASLSKVINSFSQSYEKKEAQVELLKEFYYYVQVASFSRHTNATRTYGKLKKQGFDTSIKKIEKSNKTFYRVCVGQFQNKSDADVELNKLKASGYEARIFP